ANYTLAANATELLTETLFLFGLAILFWLLLEAGDSLRHAALAGLTLGALVLLRSVALPLLPLGALWLFLRRRPPADRPSAPRFRLHVSRFTLLCSLLFVLCSLLVILPWTI